MLYCRRDGQGTADLLVQRDDGCHTIPLMRRFAHW
jgi:hypothetical protein